MFIISAIVVFLDQLSKFIIRAYLEPGDIIGGTFAITYVTNKGGIFGILHGWGFIFTMAAIIGIVVILIALRSIRSKAIKIALSLALGGAIGNLIDRIIFGEVLDFIKLGFWPVFNIADASITLSMVIIVLYFIWGRR